MKGIAKTLMALTLTVSTATFAHAGYCGTKNKDIVDTAVAAGSFKTLAAALTEAGLVDALKGDGPFTVFAPTDEAFAKLPKGTVESLLKPENREQLVSILTYHVVSGRVKAEQVTKLDAADTLNGQRVDIKVMDGTVMVDNATVTATDIIASNGVIHVIDNVILPTSKTIVGVADEAGSFKTLLAAVKAAGLAEALMGEGPYTVFAPTDEAFSELAPGTVESLLEKENLEKLQTILKYHVASGRVFSNDVLKTDSLETLAGLNVKVSVRNGKPMANDSAIVATDIDASNGVIHVIDGVLLPPEGQETLSKSARLIEMAINRGAPMYNHGNAAGCAAVYEMAANALVSVDMNIPDEARMALQDGLSKMSHSDDSGEQAWIMRRALDRAYDSMIMAMARQ